MTSTAFERVIDAFRDQGLTVDERGDKAAAQAPGHSPADRSVSIARSDGKALVHSHSDDTAEVLAAVGLTHNDLFDDRRGSGKAPESTLTAGQKLLRDRRRTEQRARRSELDQAHADEFARELAEAGRIAAQENPGLPSRGDHVLQLIERFLSRFVSYPSEAARVAHVLWIAHAWLMPAWESTPRIAFLSPEPGSGKSRALEVTEPLVPRPVHAVNTTPAYLFRKVADEAGPPTILYDEIDTVFGPRAKDNEDIRGMLNAGHRKGATAGRCVIRGKNVETEELEAYCAVALAGLDDLPDTIMTRSVVVRMRRRAPGEKVEPWRLRINGPEAEELAAEIKGWTASVALQAGESWPEMPDGVEDRDADVWEALLAVADLAGGDWPQRARGSAVTLVTASKDRTPSLGVMLLRDIRIAFGTETRMSTENILSALNDLDESPWATIRRGDPLDARGLSTRLGKYGIRPAQWREGEDRHRGYLAADLTDAWERYLPPVDPQESVTPVTTVTQPPVVTAVTGVTELSGPTLCPICQSPMTFADDLAVGHHIACREN
ncbi:DUF3631 domain-containing protein [Gordonia sp. SMJS1]|uniref:DUF3631 domain-containing protein n=1 Tax=Gordonia sp. SMJS1 TaxID=3039400 RepID=UPI002458877A|nr:DUF3631 domain-containing protein [Gordonia sp. SMJS1]WGJ86077.1 DUF3631 domain-containing protein [Gordonia sp. SMJS1]